MPARPRDSRIGGFQPVIVLRRAPTRNTSVLARSAAFSAADIQKLYRIRKASCLALILCLRHPKNHSIRSVLLMLRRFNNQMCAPMVLYRTVLQPKNRTIQSLEWADDFVREFFLFNDRAQLRAVLASLRAPISLKLPGVNTGFVDSEFAFLLYLYRMANRAKLTLMSTVFGEDYSVISRALAAFGSWLYDAHSHRLTDSLHYWSQYTQLYNSKIVARGVPPAFTRVWGFLDATLVCTARPSDVAQVCFPAPAAPAVIWDIDAQYLFYCAYAMQHCGGSVKARAQVLVSTQRLHTCEGEIHLLGGAGPGLKPGRSRPARHATQRRRRVQQHMSTAESTTVLLVDLCGCRGQLHTIHPLTTSFVTRR
jgi:hypothetical protein